MDPAWRIGKRYGKGSRRLKLALPRRIASDERLGLRAGVRRFGRELPYRWPLGLAAAGLLAAIALSLWQTAPTPSPDLVLTLLDAPPQSAPPETKAERSAAVAEEEKREAAPTPRRRARPRRPLPQIDALPHIAAARDATDVPRAARGAVPLPVAPRLDGSRPTPPAVSAPGPAVRSSIATPRRGSDRVGPPRPAPVALDSGASTDGGAVAAARAAVPAPSDGTVRGADSGSDVRGVPLDALASCLSDRREDELKSRVIARVPERMTCESANGLYRFVETKNLNAFLMWIERAAHRREADRCEELTLALECLSTGVVEREPRES